tara:strand:- start:447 stop:785 length:339 start_codon:yes stop_codon:yes gene_type:complete
MAILTEEFIAEQLVHIESWADESHLRDVDEILDWIEKYKFDSIVDQMNDGADVDKICIANISKEQWGLIKNRNPNSGIFQEINDQILFDYYVSNIDVEYEIHTLLLSQDVGE